MTVSQLTAPLYPALARAAARITDPAERALFIAQAHAADEYDAATDGAYHHSMSSDAADRAYRIASREYDRASAALIAYRRSHR